MFLTLDAARQFLAEVEKLPDALTKRIEAELDKVRDGLDARIAKLENAGGADLDSKVKAALAKLESDGLDLSSLKSAVGNLGGADLNKQAAGDGPSEPQPKSEGSKRADLTSLSGGFPGVDNASDGDKPASTDPVKAGAAAAGKARAEGGDPVTEAAKAAHAEAKRGGMTDLEANKAAADAARAEGAGEVEAARAATNAALASDV